MMHGDSRVMVVVCLETASLPAPCLSTSTSPRSREEPKKMVSLTSEHYHGTESIIDVLSKTAPHDYKDFAPGQKQQLASLINHINSLSQLINKKVK
ncbi:hypothetical protein J6625_15210 [Aeromonas caviae]|uniref:hypothetical protein n=1 Tax=Aeromonas caviae TaxID=648 RepID=UPI00208F57CE|nr:hypothetical protein [Aeromonas caviae]USP61309.1 hypothetical protein J6625_15210 [Aeromonas caviae]